jgi:signal transduction histidine kinase/ABC-type uncharacterized transport system substrate-binding protein
MRIDRRWLVWLTLTLNLVSLHVFAQSAHKVLILDEGDFTRPFFVEHAFAIRKLLTNQSPNDTEVDIEMLDLDRFPDRMHRARLQHLLADKHRRRPPDAIVVQGARALDFATQLRDELGARIPIVYTAIEDIQLSTMQLPPRTTGVSNLNTFIDHIRFIRGLLPDTKRIAIVGNTVLPGTYPVSIGRELAKLEGTVDIINLIDVPIAQLMRRVDRLPSDTVIFYYGISADKSGRIYLPHEGLATLSQVANSPIFVPTSNLMGFGATGGLMLGPQDGTREVADLTRRILAGKSLSDIGPLRIDTRKAVFDHRQLVKWGIDRQTLPEDSELMFYEPSLWERYSREIMLVALILAFQSATIVMLIIEHRRRRRAELEFRRSLADLAQLNRTTALGELSASIAHELNQPLAAIQSNAEAAEAVLRSEPPAVVEARAILSDIQRDNQRAAGIIKSMRAMFRKENPILEPVSLNEVVREMLRFVDWEARSQGIQLIAKIDATAGSVMGDRIQLDQVVLNLLTNAIEATYSSENHRTVTIGTQRTDKGEVELYVEDSGPGIPAEELPHIFNPYYTTKTQGMGMGLSISRNIVEAHGGRLKVESAPGNGARFRFVLKGL